MRRSWLHSCDAVFGGQNLDREEGGPYSSTAIRTFALVPPRSDYALGTLFRGVHPALQSSHAAQPAVVIIGFAPEIFRHLRVWQNQEALLVEPLHHGFGDILRRHRAFYQEV